MSIKRQVRLYRKIKKIFLVAGLFMAVIIISLAGRRASADNTSFVKPDNMVYHVYTVKAGDTLWSIAETYKWEGCTTRGYMREVMHVNNMADSTIKSGQDLIIPILPVGDAE